MGYSLYRVVFYASLSNQKLISTIRSRVVKFSQLPDIELKKLFSGQPLILYKAVDRELAIQYRAVISAAGGICEIEPLSRAREVDNIGFIERRRVPRNAAALEPSFGV